MKVMIGALWLTLAAGGLARAAAPSDGVLATVHQFIDNFNRGDTKAAEAAHAPDVAIIDEIPPHEWHGTGAFQAWVADLEKASQAAGQTDEKVTLGRSIRTQVDGDTAYAVVPVTFTFKQHGKPMIEPAQMAFALRKEPAGWKITGWAWSGTVPHPARAGAKPKR